MEFLFHLKYVKGILLAHASYGGTVWK